MIAVVFPGQGSQRPGMGVPWERTPSWSVVDEVSDATGIDVAHLLIEADADELRATEHAQVALFAVAQVVLAACVGAGIRPAVVAGHSVGELSALVAAGVLERAPAARLVAARGLAMAEASALHPGAMVAVLGLDAEATAVACAPIEGAWVANDNAADQQVIAGTVRGVEQAVAAVTAAGARRTMRLDVSGAFHTPLMAHAESALATALDTTPFAIPSVPFVANVDAEVHDGADGCRASVRRQVTSPVRWRACMGRLAGLGVTTALELGGRTLSGIARRSDALVRIRPVLRPEDLTDLLAEAST